MSFELSNSEGVMDDASGDRDGLHSLYTNIKSSFRYIIRQTGKEKKRIQHMHFIV